jgi:hypothetical protein
MPQTAKSHSIFGIATCIIGILTFVFYLIGIGFFNLVDGKTAGDLWIFNVGFLMFVPIPIHLICLILAVISLFFKSRKKLFGILGVGLNLIFALASLFPWLYIGFLGLMSGGVR